MTDTEITDYFNESGDPGVFPVARAENYRDVPGWMSLEFFLRNEMNITHVRALDTFRKFYNHYLKRFPVHYFTEQSLPGIDFALYFPAKLHINGIKNAHYLVAISGKDKKLVLFHKSILPQIKTRENFFRLTNRWMNEGFLTDRKVSYNIEDILDICDKPQDLLALRQERFSGFLDKVQHKMKGMRLDRPFEGKWDKIRAFLEERDMKHLGRIIERLKNEHISIDAAKQVAQVSDNNVGIYNWIMAGADATAVRNRTQITTRFPWLVTALANEKTAADYAPLEKAIDNGDRFMDALEDFFSEGLETPVRQSTVRGLLDLQIKSDILFAQVLRPLIQKVDKYSSSSILEPGALENIHHYKTYTKKVCSYLKSDFVELFNAMVPRDREQLRVSARGHDMAAREMENTADFMGEVYRKLVLPYFIHKSVEAGNAGLPDPIERALLGALDNNDSLDSSFAYRNHYQIPHPPYLRPFGNISFSNILKLSQKWHREQKTYNARMAVTDVDQTQRWPSLTGKVEAENKVTIEPLNSKWLLEKEGEEMGHCIANYTPQCLGLVVKPDAMRAYSHIFKLKLDGQSKHRATLEILEPYFSSGGKRTVMFSAIENKRRIFEVKNFSDVDSPEYIAAMWYVKQINEGEIKVNWEMMDAQRASLRTGKTLGLLALEVGFDPLDRAKREEAYRTFQPYLQSRDLYYTYDEWTERMGFSRDAQRLFPAERRELTLRDLTLDI